jgi:factor associated with neutral sphingomyelinase activation
VDLDSITDLSARHALEVQIAEFGQIPKQLFLKPHAARFTTIPQTVPEFVRRMSCDNRKNMECRKTLPNQTQLPVVGDFQMSAQMSAHKDEIMSIHLFGENNLVSTGKDGNLKCYNFQEKRQTRMVPIGDGSPLSSVVKVPDSNVLILGSWNNSM